MSNVHHPASAIIKMRTCYVCIIMHLMGLILLPSSAMSQQSMSETITLRGLVTDKTTGESVDMATIHLFHGESGKLSGYTFSDENGYFSIQVKKIDSLQISVSLLGYKTYKQPIENNETLHIALEQQIFNLREVQITPGRIWGKQDTINYDISQFLSEKDETIKDVINKLPGVNVDETGQISYNGKNISNLYVEGLDLSDGKYNKITNNLDAKSVETVQLMQNHQPIRILQKAISTEDVAMNIKLKPEFRSKWMFTLQGGTGFSPFLWNTSANAMQLSRGSQSTYTYKTNNTGNDIVDEQLMLISRISGSTREPEIRSFLNHPSIMAPLKKERLLFNDVHSISGNRLYKLNETMQLRINADYTHDIRKQERGSETSYFYPDDTVHIAEQSHNRIQSDEAGVKAHLENNAADKYLTNEFEVWGNRRKSDAVISGDQNINQQIKTPALKLRNNLRCLWNKSDYMYEALSLLSYNHRPSELITDDLQQYMNVNHFYTENYFSALHKKGIFTQQYSTGFNVEGNNIQNRYGVYVNPLWQINAGKWQLKLSVPLLFTHFSDSRNASYTVTDVDNRKKRITANPSFSALYKLNYAWRFSFSAKYNEQYGNIIDLYTFPYSTDYRHIRQNNGTLPVRRTQSYSAYGEYKNTINEFFATLSFYYSRNWSNQIDEQTFKDDKVIYSSRQQSNNSDTWLIRGTFSKGFYDIKMKLSLNYHFSHTRSQQLNNSKKIPFELSYMQYEPKINQTISRNFEIAYETKLLYGGSKIGDNTKLTPLWNITQKLLLNYSLSDFEITLSADHYHNDISDNKSVDACFADISLKWKHDNWQFITSANNLFDKQQYRYTQYSNIQSYTSWINIRGREFLLSARYRF